MIRGFLSGIRTRTRNNLLRAVAVGTGLLVLAQCVTEQPSRPWYGNGVVASSSPIASQVGVDIMRRGGNAFDAAVAVGFALAVTHPQAGNIGGGGFALIRDGQTETVRALDFREKAPLLASATMYLDDSGRVIDDLSLTGALAAGVPGTVSGLHTLWREQGRLPWKELVAPAIALADTGYILDDARAEAIASYRNRLREFPETAALFLPGGNTPTAGDRLILSDLAETLRLIADQGPDGFYSGPVAEAIVSCMQRHGGLISFADLTAYQSIWRSPIHFRFDLLDIYSMPPPSSGGIVLAQILRLLEPFALGEFKPDAPEFIHLFCEAARLAYADRSTHLGDPEYYTIPGELLEPEYLDKRRALIPRSMAGRSETTRPGDFRTPESDQTTHYSICDGKGNMVAITTTLNANFGSKLVVQGAGFLLNDEMDDFAIKPGHANYYGLVGGIANQIEPGKRMLSSMTPTLVLKDSQPYLILGSPGGSKIITTVAQAIINLSRFGMTPREAASYPRFHHQWLPDRIDLEERSFPIQTMQGLIGIGHDVRERPRYGDLEIIEISPTGAMNPASDPRGGGAPAGF